MNLLFSVTGLSSKTWELEVKILYPVDSNYCYKFESNTNLQNANKEKNDVFLNFWDGKYNLILLQKSRKKRWSLDKNRYCEKE